MFHSKMGRFLVAALQFPFFEDNARAELGDRLRNLQWMNDGCFL